MDDIFPDSTFPDVSPDEIFQTLASCGIDISNFSDEELGEAIAAAISGSHPGVAFTGQHHDSGLDSVSSRSGGISFSGYTADYQGIKDCWYGSDGKVYDRGGNCVGTH